MNTLSPICRFLLNKKDAASSHPSGYTLTEVVGWSDERLERTHDYIQWCFPLTIPSQYAPTAPVLTLNDVRFIQSSPLCQNNLRVIRGAMSEFYRRTEPWRHGSDHNHMRITRIIKSTSLLTSTEEAGLFYLFIALELNRIPDSTIKFWRDAVTN